MHPTAHDDVAQRATYLSLTGLFLTLLTAFSARERRHGDDARIEGLDLVMLGLATFRAGRLVAFDRVTRPWREPFTQTVPDGMGAGETVAPEGAGPRRALGELLSCPVCTGTWIAAFLVYGLRLAPRPARILLAILSATGIAELLNDGAEALAWSGRVSHKRAGQ